MQKILVTTDFSDKSKAGLLFAIQLASQNNFNITFFHVYHVLVPTQWSAAKIDEYENKETKKIQDKLNLFVAQIYKGLNLPKSSSKCVIISSLFPQGSIMEYSMENKFDYICISTRGAGNLQRLLGTNTANLINHSNIPVIAVPYNYKPTKITSILYASDLANLDYELKKIVAFAKPLNSTVELFHITSPLDSNTDSKVLKATVDKLSKYDIKMNIKNTDYVQTLIDNITAAVKKVKPSMMIMFTEQNRNLCEKLFLSSKSAEYSFKTQVPLLVFNK